MGLSTALSLAREKAAELFSGTFGGERKIYDILGYKQKPTISDFYTRVSREGIPWLVVSTVPQSMWLRGIHVLESTDSDADNLTPFESAIRAIDKKHRLNSVFQSADIQSRIGRYSCILLQIGDGGNLESPVEVSNSSFDADRLLGLQVYGEDRVSICDLITDETDPLMGMPSAYEIDIGRAIINSNLTSFASGYNKKKVHHSRMLHVTPDPCDGRVYSNPVLKLVWNYLDDLMKIVGGCAEAYWNKAELRLVAKLAMDFRGGDDKFEELDEQLEQFVKNRSQVLRIRGVDVDNIDSKIDGFADDAKLVLTLISAIERIPQRTFLGSEVGRQNSEQDAANFSNVIEGRWRSFGEPLVRSFVDRLIEFGVIPPPASGDYVVVRPKDQRSNVAQSAVPSCRIAETSMRLVEAGEPPLMTVEEIRRILLDMDS